MKKILFNVTIMAVLAACTSNDFVGGEDLKVANENAAISFTSSSGAITRAEIGGAAAAALLNNNFVVEGIKTVSSSPSTVEVFDNYNVNWAANTANKTLSNSANWEYVNQDILTGKTQVSEQSIKYWDFAATKYDFWAYSLGGGSAEVVSLDHNATLGTSAYTITGSLTDLSKVYISDLVTAYWPEVTGKPKMGDQVNLKFRSLVSKVRIGLYETIPGYSVKNVQFYPSASGTPDEAPTLYASTPVLPAETGSPATAKYTVKFLTTGSTNINDPDYNKAHVALTSSGLTSSISFDNLIYGAKETGKHEKTDGNVWVQRSSNSPTWASESYKTVLPYETGAVLTLKVDYTLESTDGTGETITVHGATALIPSQFAQWKPNYAYTYLFKISDNTNGKTNTTVDKVGLYPITLDAVVEGSTDGTQETVTTVATPSITTYSITSNVTTNNEYKTSDDIYVTASNDGTLLDMTGKAVLYTVSKPGATEAEVLAALTTYKSKTDDTYVGRNNITLTQVSDGLDLTKTEIPLVDGNKIAVTAKHVALINKSVLNAGTYAFVYKISDPTSTPSDIYEAVTPESGANVTSYYNRTGEEEPYTYSQASGTANGTTVYYDKYTTSNAQYAIKVIKVVSGS